MKLSAAVYLHFIPPAAALVLLIAAGTAFSGCYTLKQGTTMLGYLGRAVPLEELALPDAAEDERRFAERITDIRRFAMEELGLKESKNYTRYVKLDRDYLAAVVSACAADSFTRHEWSFPVVGKVPYKGFFDPEDAQKEAAKLRAKGLDVWVRGVDAFSTLGWFRDPLYSYMKNYPVYDLANLIIHELLHATVFVKGHVQFNEQLAEFVGSRGARLYIESRFGLDSREYRDIDAGTADRAAFLEFTGALITDLETLYGNASLDRETKLVEKEKIIRAAQERFEAEYDQRFVTARYRGFPGIQVNNAYLDLYRLYYEKDDFFTGLYGQMPVTWNDADGNPEILHLKAFIGAAASLSGSKTARKDPRGQLEKALTPDYGY